MNREELVRLAKTVTEKEWPAVLASYLAEQRAKPIPQRLEELEATTLLLSVGFLRMEDALERLVNKLGRL